MVLTQLCDGALIHEFTDHNFCHTYTSLVLKNKKASPLELRGYTTMHSAPVVTMTSKYLPSGFKRPLG
jgi:hypothetical protein